MELSKYTLNRRALLTVLLSGAGGLALIGGLTGVIPLSAEPALTREDVTLYKNPQCGCSEGYADYLRQSGFKVKAISTNDLTVMGQKYGIADDMQPCHISLIGGYVVGGHIPFEIIDRLLSEKPQIVGITLPGMPEGTPGMPGNKQAPSKFTRSGRVSPRFMRRFSGSGGKCHLGPSR
jgi:hypothetical protein